MGRDVRTRRTGSGTRDAAGAPAPLAPDRDEQDPSAEDPSVGADPGAPVDGASAASSPESGSVTASDAPGASASVPDRVEEAPASERRAQGDAPEDGEEGPSSPRAQAASSADPRAQPSVVPGEVPDEWEPPPSSSDADVARAGDGPEMLEEAEQERAPEPPAPEPPAPEPEPEDRAPTPASPSPHVAPPVVSDRSVQAPALRGVLCRVAGPGSVAGDGVRLDGRPAHFWEPGARGYFSQASVDKLPTLLIPEPGER